MACIIKLPASNKKHVEKFLRSSNFQKGQELDRTFVRWLRCDAKLLEKFENIRIALWSLAFACTRCHDLIAVTLQFTVPEKDSK